MFLEKIHVLGQAGPEIGKGDGKRPILIAAGRPRGSTHAKLPFLYTSGFQRAFNPNTDHIF